MDYSLGLLEVSALGHAIIALDAMLKVADVEFVATERKLGGRLVTLVVKGELTAVQASIDAGIASARSNGVYKASNVIARPHEEILKFLHLDEEHEKEINSESAATHVGKVPSRRRRTAPKVQNDTKTETEATTEEKPAEETKAPARRGRRRKTEPENAEK
jgi:microcompartment protein CcmL/EutN